MIFARGDRFMMPGCVRVHLVMNGKHVGYTIIAISDWKRLLEELL